MSWAGEQRGALRTLLSLAFDPDELRRWRAIEALGRVAATRSGNDPESMRVVVRHLFWSMNDESGNVGWYAPEAIGEILFNHTPLIDEYGRILASFMREEPFERGTHWAMARVATVRPDVYGDCVEELIRSTSDSDPLIRGCAAAVLRALGAGDERVRTLADDPAEVALYDFRTGTMARTTVGRMARGGLDPDDS